MLGRCPKGFGGGSRGYDYKGSLEYLFFDRTGNNGNNDYNTRRFHQLKRASELSWNRNSSGEEIALIAAGIVGGALFLGAGKLQSARFSFLQVFQRRRPKLHG